MSVCSPLDLSPYIEKRPNAPYGLPGERDELSCEGAFLATCEALKRGEPFSIVRMSDGETEILDYCDAHKYDEPMLKYPDFWNKRYGVAGITCGEMKRRLYKAAEECTLLAQDGWLPYCVNGVRRFIHRQPFVWPRFPEVWTAREKRQLYQLADNHVTVINRDLDLAKQVAGNVLCMAYIPLDNWRESESVIEAAAIFKARLVLTSCGPASKYICPEIAKTGKVVLDIGSVPERGWWNEEPRA